MEFQQSGAIEAVTSDSGTKRGWITFPFIAATYLGLTLSTAGRLVNMILYLIQEFNVKIIDASQVFNAVNGFINIIPIIAAVLADSFFGSFSTIAYSTCFSLLVVLLLILTATITSLRPPPCEPGHACQAPKPLQYFVLFSGIVLASIGMGGARFTLAAMGANQFHKTKDQEVFLNWYLFIFNVATVASMVVIAYVQENISWGLGFGLCAAANSAGLAVFLLGKRFYHHEQSRGSPYTDLARVIVAAVRKRNLQLSSESADCNNENDATNKIMIATPTHSLRFLNRAALKSELDANGSISAAKPWRLCTIEQVEDLKALVRIFPLWTSSVFLATPMFFQATMTVIQALSMDRRVGSIFEIPAGSITVVLYISCSVFIPLLDFILFPTWKNLTRKSPTPLQRIGIGHVFNILGMITAALVESRRLQIAHSTRTHTPTPALWLIPQLVLVGIGKAFHFPGQVALYYQEFPVSLRTTATAMVAVVGFLNFGYFSVCSCLYRYRNNNVARLG